MATSKFSLAKPKIIRFFDHHPQRVFKQKELAAILRNNRSEWALAKHTNPNEFTDLLAKTGLLKKLEFLFPSRSETRYAWRKAPQLEVLSTLNPRAYFSHHTAARLHKLTTANLQVIYINLEQRPHPNSGGTLTQQGIDRAFSNAPRTSSNVVELNGTQIFLLNGKNSDALGVANHETIYERAKVKVRVTSIERTLIDLTVRPAYAGGVAEVAQAFRNARGRVSIPQMAAMLVDLSYVYPYHQAIGFYLELAMYPPNDVAPFKSMSMNFDFYLANKLSDTRYVQEWRLNVPQTI